MLNLAAKVQLAICFSKLDLVTGPNPGIKPGGNKIYVHLHGKLTIQPWAKKLC